MVGLTAALFFKLCSRQQSTPSSTSETRFSVTMNKLNQTFLLTRGPGINLNETFTGMLSVLSSSERCLVQRVSQTYHSPGHRVGHRILSRSFKERSVLSRSFCEFLAT